jgi:monofunctional biosynthetic peptidoglycan transglycosylase
VILTLLITIPFRWIDPPTSSIMLQRHLASRSGGRPRPTYEWLDRSEISPYLVAAVVAAEDQKFPDHFGFDFASIADALREAGGRRRGASTISQQVVKNLYLWPGRSLVRKGLEAYLTVAIETLWPKRRILEVYLNIAEFGPDVFGAGAASQTHCGKPAALLSAREAALLAAVLPGPARLSAGRPSDYVRARADEIASEARRMRARGALRGL